jgi:hypothetical protein
LHFTAPTDLRGSVPLIQRLSKKYIVLGVVVAFLVLLRAITPALILRYVNDYLDHNIKGYRAHIEDMDLAIWRGAYSFDHFWVAKAGFEDKPFFAFDKAELALSWKAIFHGMVSGHVKVHHLKMNIIDSKEDKPTQTGKDQEGLVDVLGKLFPIQLETLVFTDSELHFMNFDRKLPADLSLTNIELRGKNLNNINKNPDELPSELHIQGLLMNRSDVDVDGRVNIIVKPPQFDLKGKVENFNMSLANPILLSYFPFTLTKGNLNLQANAKTKGENLSGVLHLQMSDVDVISSKDNMSTFKRTGYEILFALGNLILRNPKNKEIKTTLLFSGPLKNIKFDTDTAVKTTLENAFPTPKTQYTPPPLRAHDTDKPN